MVRVCTCAIDSAVVLGNANKKGEENVQYFFHFSHFFCKPENAKSFKNMTHISFILQLLCLDRPNLSMHFRVTVSYLLDALINAHEPTTITCSQVTSFLKKQNFFRFQLENCYRYLKKE